MLYRGLILAEALDASWVSRLSRNSRNSIKYFGDGSGCVNFRWRKRLARPSY